jgi:tripartite-type tricarboxylate transporter receptor subunit TctC
MFQTIARRTLALALACTCLICPAQAQNDNKPHALSCPSPPAAPPTSCRACWPRSCADAYPAGMVVENKSGAGGNIGAEFVYARRARRHHLLASPPGPIAINQHLYKKLSFDPAKWVPVTVHGHGAQRAGRQHQAAGDNLAEFIAYLKANPGKVSYASQGNGSTSHLTAACSCS